MTEIITLGGGCFWCTEAIFDRVRGVTDVESGYANGLVDSPTYEAVCQGTTGHAEVVKLTYDPAEISLRQILEIFFATHDPTTLNRQGNDVGTQYRSGIYYTNADQKEVIDTLRRDCGDRGAGASELLACRGIPSGLLQTASQSGLLRVCRGAQGRQVQEDFCAAFEARRLIASCFCVTLDGSADTLGVCIFSTHESTPFPAATFRHVLAVAGTGACARVGPRAPGGACARDESALCTGTSTAAGRAIDRQAGRGCHSRTVCRPQQGRVRIARSDGAGPCAVGQGLAAAASAAIRGSRCRCFR